MSISPFQYIIENTSLNHPMLHGVIFSYNNLNIQVHKDNVENLVCVENIIFFGECFDYENPSFSNKEIVITLASLSFKEKIDKINKLTGFFLFIIFENDATFVFNDAAGQLEVFIYHNADEFYVASQPNLMPIELELDQDAPPYIIENRITVFNKTPFKQVEKLIPNFYYDVSIGKSVRFFPEQKPIEKEINQVAKEAIGILSKTYESLLNRKNVALAVTAGWDSRVLFAASLNQKKEIAYYVSNHQTEDGKVDVKTSNQIITSFNKKLNVIDYDLSQIILDNKKKPTIWKDEEKLHKMAMVMQTHYPNHYIVNGNISEVARNFYDPLPKKLSLSDICFIIGVKEGEYEKNAIKKWIETTDKNLHLLDSIYWEHKMPNWAGSAKSISNLYNTIVSPFNNRHLLTLLLSTKRRDRDKYFHKIYQKIFEIIDKKLVEIPINPTKKHNQIVFMKKIGLYPLYRFLFFKLRKLKF